MLVAQRFESVTVTVNTAAAAEGRARETGGERPELDKLIPPAASRPFARRCMGGYPAAGSQRLAVRRPDIAEGQRRRRHRDGRTTNLDRVESLARATTGGIDRGHLECERTQHRRCARDRAGAGQHDPRRQRPRRPYKAYAAHSVARRNRLVIDRPQSGIRQCLRHQRERASN